MSKKTAIFGATPNSERYAYLAAERLTQKNHDVIPIGIKKGSIFGHEILNLREKPPIKGLDTITMYIGPQNQEEWEDYILSLHPKRIIFNPGSENPSLARKANERGIHVEFACTLVMLGNGIY